jgi:hypothetical protein
MLLLKATVAVVMVVEEMAVVVMAVEEMVAVAMGEAMLVLPQAATQPRRLRNLSGPTTAPARTTRTRGRFGRTMIQIR